MIVQTGSNFRNVNESMDKFIIRAEGTGAPVSKIFYSGGVHEFDYKQDAPRTKEIIEATLSFIKDNM